MSSVLSVIIGYLGMAAVMIGSALAAGALIPGGIRAAKEMKSAPPRNYLYANLALSFVAAMLGGWLCARRAPFSPMIHAGVLAALLLAMSLLSARSFGANQPVWYQKTIALIGFLRVLLGAAIQVLAA